MLKVNWLFISLVICGAFSIVHGQQKEFMYDGQTRKYVVYEPELDPNPTGHPLIIGLHGTGSNGAGFIATAFLVQKASNEKFLVACPDALVNGIFTYFNAGDGYEELTNGTDDIGFISALIDTMIANYDVDTTRIYAMGFSNGDMMAYRMAAELSHRIAAIGGSSGPMVYENCDPEYPVPIIHFHGLSDPLVPYEGKGDSILVVPPVDTVMAIWREINGCAPDAEILMNENGIIGKKWASANGQSDVVLYTIQEQEHDWPRPANFGISATDVIWDFFKAQQRVVITTNAEKNHPPAIPTNCKLYQNYPNPFNPFTKIRYNLSEPGEVKLKVYNLAGEEIETLVNGFQSAGEYEITWQPKGLASGVYFYKIVSGADSEVRKLIFLK